MKKVFISHRSLDDNVCSFFKDMLILCGMKNEEILYTSAKETGLEYEITPEIKAGIKETQVDIIFLSPSYLESVYCCTEMGALAMKDTPTIIFGIKGISYKDNDGLQGKEILIKNLLEESDLFQVIDIIEKKFGVNSTKNEVKGQAKKVINNYKSVLEYYKDSEKKSKGTDNREDLSKVVKTLQDKILLLESTNKDLDNKLNIVNSLGTMDEHLMKETIITYRIGRSKKKKIFLWKDLYFSILASREGDCINENNVEYWMQIILNEDSKYRISSYDHNKIKKTLEVDKKNVQQFIQKCMSFNLLLTVVEKDIFRSKKYELTKKGRELMDIITKESI